MKEITIADIRCQANDILTLNEGHILYQKRLYSNFKYKVSRYHGLILDGMVDFDDIHTSLTLGDGVHSTCSCDNGFCKHKTALYFLLKDTLSDLRKNNNDIEANISYDINSIMNSFINEVKTRYSKYKIQPIIFLSDKKIELSLALKYGNNETVIKEIYNFINSYKQNLKFNVANSSIPNGKNYYDSISLNFLEILSLYNSTNNLYPITLLEQIYNIYKDDYIYLSNNRFERIYFSSDKLPIKFKYENKKIILKEKLKLYKSLSKTFILRKNYIYVLDNYVDNKLLSLMNFETEDNVVFSFDSENELLFYTIIYDGLENYFDIIGDNPVKFKINTYLDYKNEILNLDYQIVDDSNIELNLPIKTIKEMNYEDMLSSFGFVKADTYKLVSEELIVEVITNHITDFSKYGSVYLNDSCKTISRFKGSKFDYHFGLDGSFFDIIFKDITYSKEELREIFNGYHLKRKYVKLKNGELVLLDDAGYELYKMAKDLNLLDKDLNKKLELPFYQLYKLETFKDLMNDKNYFDSFYNDFCNYSNEAALDVELKNKLRDYQIKGFNWLFVLHKYRLGGILADDMGLGKTIEVIAFISTINRKKPILIVSPTSLVLNWEAEFLRFAPNLKPIIISGNSDTRVEQIKKITNEDIIITSYESIRIDNELFAKYEYDVIIADEAQYMKNPFAYKSIAMKKLKSNSSFALTGTPIENNIIDLWSIFDFILPGYLPNKRDYSALYSNSVFDLAKLSKQVAPFILRREKQKVLSLPPKIENNVYAYLEGEQLKAYEAYLNNVQEELRNSDYAISYVLKTLIRLREFMCEPRLFIENYEGENAKLKTLIEIITESIADGHRILVFSSFPSVFKYITPLLSKNNITYDILDGKTPKEERLAKVNAFNENSDINVFLISLKVGGSGLNLHQADMVIHYDPWWNVAATNQATDRAHRFGQTKEVHVIKLIVKDTIEEKIIALQNKKAKLSNEVINENNFIKQLKKEDIIELFGGKK